MRKSPKFSPEVIARAVRMVFDAKDQYPSQWAAIESIAARQGRVRGDAAPRGHDQPGQFRMRLNGSGVRARCWRCDAGTYRSQATRVRSS